LSQHRVDGVWRVTVAYTVNGFTFWRGMPAQECRPVDNRSISANNAGMSHRIIRAGEGEVLGSVDGCRDRFLIDSKDWGGRLAVVEHLLAPHSIAAPMHRHTKEDEFSLILEGQVWYHAAGEELTAAVGDLVFKPRGEWHTFWNAADQPARVLEIISPGGLEEAFRFIDTAAPDVDLGPVIEPYGCEGDMEATLPIMEKHGLTFG